MPGGSRPLTGYGHDCRNERGTVSLRYYLDHHVPASVARGLRDGGVDVVTANEDSMHDVEDAGLLDRATSLGRVMVTQDADFPAIAHNYLSSGKYFFGIVYAHQLRVTIRRMIDDLVLLATAGAESDVSNNVVYLPLS